MIADINRRIFVAWVGATSFVLAAWTHGTPTGGNFLTDNTGAALLTDGSGLPLIAS